MKKIDLTNSSDNIRREKNFTRLRISFGGICALLIAALFLVPQKTIYAQAGCDATVPTYNVDFTGHPDSVFNTPSVSRAGNCCGTSSPERCLHFNITLDSTTAAVNFNITSGAIPSGSLFYQVDCGPQTAVGTAICVSGVGHHDLTFCKPGNNTNTYSVEAIPKPIFPPNDSVRIGCSKNITLYGLDTSTVTFNSIFPGASGAYNSYLSCTSNCTNPLFTPQTGAPAYIDYMVCGMARANNCPGLNGTFCDTVRMYVFSKIVISVSPNPATYCPSSSGVTLTSTVTGGFGTYAYTWKNGSGATVSTSSTYFATTGTYKLFVTDYLSSINTCNLDSVVIPVTISNVVLTSSQTNVACGGGSNGTATVTTTGGSPPYTYHWSNNATTSSLTGLTVGTYSVTVSDNSSCTQTASFTVTQPVPFAVAIDTANTRNVSCHGNENGRISVIVTGGVAPDSFLWSPGGYTTQNISNLDTGTYTVTVTDAHGCIGTVSQTLTQPSSIVPISPPVGTSSNLTCYQNFTGAACINTGLLGGTPPYTFSWNNSATVACISSLSAGSYCVQIMDANLCTTDTCFTILQPLPLGSGFDSVAAYPGDYNESCFGASDGGFDFQVTGGTPPFSYLWNTGDTTRNLSGIPAGPYCVTITDSDGCVATNCITLIQPPPVADSLISDIYNGYNIPCRGQQSGDIFTYPFGGFGAFSFIWTGPSGYTSTVQNPNNLFAGFYSVTITDFNGCPRMDTITLTEPDTIVPLITAVDLNGVNISCFGGTDGQVSATATGGTGPGTYTYTWIPGNSHADTLFSLPSGDYCVRVTDLNGCFKDTCTELLEPNPLTDSISDVPQSGFGVSCNGLADATISIISVTGGIDSLPYAYHWSNNATTTTVNGLSSGFYYLTITDANGCIKLDTFFVTQPPVLSAVSTSTNPPCNGDALGSITDSVSGGTGAPYQYSWSPNTTDTTYLVNGLTVGTYCVTVTDANGCTNVTCTTLTEPTILSLDSLVSPTYPGGWNVSCNGGADGNIYSYEHGGTLLYSYYWSNGDTTQNTFNVSVTTYYLTVTDSHNCTATDSITIDEPPKVRATVTANDSVTCFGSATGVIHMSTSGGTPAYHYFLNGNPVSNPITGLIGGSYIVLVVDSNGCADSTTVIIGQPDDSLSATAVADTNVDCHGNNNGSASLTVSGGTTLYTYNWSNSGTVTSISGLTAGTYFVTITDARGCTTVVNATISEPAASLSATGIPITHVDCNTDSTGSATVTAAGGTSNYTYLWSTSATTDTINGLPAGTYFVTATDAHGCTAVSSATITQPANSLTASVAPTANVNCKGDSTGSATVTVSGGTINYIYLWSTGASTDSIIGLSAGTYIVTVTDAHGCSTVASSAVSEPAAFLTDSASAILNVDCNGNSNGSATVTVSGGTVVYFYLWSTGSSNDSISGLSAGIYAVTATDSHGCTAMASVTITEPSNSLSATGIPITHVDCNTNSTGSATVTATGGTTNYTYLWSNNATTDSISGLTAGTYFVTVTDAHGCTAVTSAIITQPANSLIDSATAVLNVNCKGDSSGSATVTVSGGTLNYLYLWSTGASTDSINGLSAGTYIVTVTDAHGCTATASTSISEPVNFLTDTAIVLLNVNCKGNSTGSATVSVSGGTVSYFYLWSTAATTDSIIGLSAGIYTVTTTDSHGCTATATATITEPADSLSLTANVIADVDCKGNSTGSATVIATGGTINYTYLWSNNATTDSILGLSVGIYTVTTTDSHGCTAVASVAISEPVNSLIANTSVISPVGCNGGNTGSATVTASGGTVSYTYLWSTTATTDSINGLAAGNYTVTVTDSHGCTTTATAIITQPANGLTADSSAVNELCNHYSTGSITFTASGGTAPFTYSWSPSVSITSTATNLSAGTYSITITDANGCSTTATETITEPPPITTSAGPDQQVCGTAANLIAQNNGVGVWHVLTGNGIVQDTAQFNTSVSNLTDSTPSGINVFQWSITDANGCTASATVTITAFLPVTASATGPDTICVQDFRGTIDSLMAATPIAGSGIWTILVGDGNLSNFDSTFTQITGAAVTTGAHVVAWTVTNGPCSAADTIQVYISHEGRCLDLDMPNGFSPNGDGHNDYYDIHGIERYPDNNFIVYNRWGNEVFNIDNYNNSSHKWDGLNNSGKPLPDGTYYVILLINGGPEVKSGTKLNTYVDLRR